MSASSPLMQQQAARQTSSPLALKMGMPLAQPPSHLQHSSNRGSEHIKQPVQ